MAQKATDVVVGQIGVCVTDNVVTKIDLVNKGAQMAYLQVSTSPSVEPSWAGAKPLMPGEMWPGAWTLADSFPGVTGPYHVWMKALQPTTIAVNHAA